jgi:D-alanyl-D-alanine carboxypeptidase
MKQQFIQLFMLMFVYQLAWAQPLAVKSCKSNEKQSTFKNANAVQALLNELTSKDIPGVSLAVYSPNGLFTATAGYASKEDRIAMQPCHLMYLQSVSKTYMSVCILKLVEQGRLQLDKPITHYLSAEHKNIFPYADSVSVRMLLNHTSGIPEYNNQEAYITKLLSIPDYPFKPKDYLQYVAQLNHDFLPGTRHAYSNTNYILLALIADAVTGDHSSFMSATIFRPAKLKATFYRNDKNYLNYSLLSNAYWDQNQDGVLVNASVLQRNNVRTLIGDDGIVSTPSDAVLFLKCLMEGKLISRAMLDTMKLWVNDSQGRPTYGLGLDLNLIGNNQAIGHSGGGIGAGCQLYYFPEKKIYVFIGINLGTITPSPIHETILPVLDKLYQIILN